ncbi:MULTISPECIES: ABC transporter ATP-binding protein [unclassified Streptomyces]|uniref:ABC transporter ATP-binding protein n=1 Tax=unclassified Streptomyces TaxID=2593676 RepID=UPI00081AF46E|nr:MULTISPECIES: ABC transporter ATP-binding protein [unclassified Streptomyces]MYQ55019.1 ATP-binding cassette domain-containing protein [Streptomyces sp. SID4941]SCE31658.1 energy-coupling factor transport system ATP-binding protein [Streptomyces sp. PalvLS-984]SDD62747.1 energy-coupling factor transport system ATP-binding protein [Streptomyces sp. AmelKG-A3]
MIRFEQVAVRYADADRPSLSGVDLTVPEGELVLLVGPSGVGKSTLLGAVSGLVPHFTGGVLTGRVTVDGRDTRTHKPRELADLVGTVGQDPLAHFVTDTVEDELAYGMESLGLAPDVMRRRVEETLDLLGLAELRDRPIATLSGGQQQRVAIGSVLTPHPKVLVLDEPTSALDPAAAEEVLAVLQRLVHDLGTTVLMAEHRLERVVQYADQVLLLPSPGAAPVLGPPADVMALSPVRPPVVDLGRLAGWDPLPLSIRDARRRAAPLRARLAPLTGPHPDAGAGAGPGQSPGPVDGRAEPDHPSASGTPVPVEPVTASRGGFLARLRGRRRTATGVPGAPGAPGDAPLPQGGVVARADGLGLRRGRVEALRRVTLSVAPGETVALMGRNGAGKSTLLSAFVGMLEPTSGSVLVGGLRPSRTAPREMVRLVGLVPQEPRDLLYADTVAAECAAADSDAGAPPGSCRALVSELLPGVPDATHPRDLSEGQRLALALALVLTARPPLLLLDEPTRGLDYAAKARLVGVLRRLAGEGHAIVLATHDVELAAESAHRVVILADGEVVADGPTARVVVSSPAFAPQTAKILAPQEWLTVTQVRTALEAAPPTEPPA